MKFENTEAFNFEGAFRGLRNPLESWNKSDSFFGFVDYDYPSDDYIDAIDQWVYHNFDVKGIEVEPYSSEWEEAYDECSEWLSVNAHIRSNFKIADTALLGPNDIGLAQRLILAGPEHMKFMRQIFVCVDITAPIYW